MRHDLENILSHFQIEGDFIRAEAIGTGHINDTYLGYFQAGKENTRYIHQRINQNVFKQPVKLMENIIRVTRFAREVISANGGDPERQTLNLVPALDGRFFYQTPEGDFWRTYYFIAGARTYDKVENLKHVFSASKAFGDFQKMLSSLPGERLHETIPDFHHTRKRFETFVQALDKDAVNRARSVKNEIEFVLCREADTSVVVGFLMRGQIPERVTHNDTKLNNVMIDDQTGEGICVIDLDTVMPGSALYDFGDSVRIGASTAVEDETDLDKVGLDLDMFARLAEGYLESARDFLTSLEVDHLVFSAKLITLEQGIRFLTDYLNGDTYYRIHRPDHNLDRTRTQIKMVREIEVKSDLMEGIVNRYR